MSEMDPFGDIGKRAFEEDQRLRRQAENEAWLAADSARIAKEKQAADLKVKQAIQEYVVPLVIAGAANLAADLVRYGAKTDKVLVENPNWPKPRPETHRKSSRGLLASFGLKSSNVSNLSSSGVMQGWVITSEDCRDTYERSGPRADWNGPFVTVGKIWREGLALGANGTLFRYGTEYVYIDYGAYYSQEPSAQRPKENCIKMDKEPFWKNFNNFSLVGVAEAEDIAPVESINPKLPADYELEQWGKLFFDQATRILSRK